MICKASYLHETDNHKDTILAVVGVDEKLIKVMKAAVMLEIKETSSYLASNMEDDDYMDAVNYIWDRLRNLIRHCTILSLKKSRNLMRRLMSKGRPSECKTQVSEDDRESVCRLREAYRLPCSTCKYFNYCTQKGILKGVSNGNCKQV